MIISIITVTLNDLVNLKKTAESLKKQTNKTFQWVIKDGFSSDGTEDYIKSIKDKYNLNISYHREKDISLYDAMNQSIKFALGEYFLFLNAGDILYAEDTLDLSLEIINNSEKHSFFYGDNYDLTTDNILIYKKARHITYLKKSLPTSHQAIFYKGSLFDKYKYSLDYKVAADYALTAQIYFDGNKNFKYLEFPICIFSLDGFSHANRKELLREGFLIHKNIVKQNLLISGTKYMIRFFTISIHDRYPKLYIRVRRFFDAFN